MPLVKETTTGENYLQKVITGADQPAISAMQMYQKQLGSDGGASNTIFTLNNPYVKSSNTLMVFLNGQKIEKVTSASTTTEFEETNSTTVTIGASLLDSDVVEFMIAGAYILDVDDINEIGGGLSWEIISSNTTATANNGYLIDASSGNVTLTLSAAPTEGDPIGMCDYKEMATTNTITIARNGKNIEGDAEDLVIDMDGSGFTLVYTDATVGWKIVSEISANGGLLTQGGTDELIVGGGSGSDGVWTTATGSGAPVRAVSPTLVTPVLGVATGTSFQGIVGNVTPAAGAFTTISASGLITATGGQIKFPATAVPSADANTLDDYEEGTWTPVIADATTAGNVASVTASGVFTRVGDMAIYSFNAWGINTTGLTAGNNVYVRDFPFAFGFSHRMFIVLENVTFDTSSIISLVCTNGLTTGYVAYNESGAYATEQVIVSLYISGSAAIRGTGIVKL